MRELFLVILMSATVTMVHAADLPDNCAAAVDAADRLASDNNQHCDYSDVGLNGVMHRALAKNSDTSADNSQNSSAQPRSIPNLQRTEMVEFKTPQQLADRRYELLQLAARQCTKGFLLEAEQYMPAGVQTLTLALVYRCLW